MKWIRKVFGNIRTVKPLTMLIVVPATLAYPAAKALISTKNRLTIFSDALLIISLILIAVGVLFTFARFGDFDITSYVFRRGAEKNIKEFGEFKKDRETQRAESFNYPLFFGVLYLALSLLIAFVFC